MNTKPFLLAALFFGGSLGASAAENAPLTGCVDLGADQEIVRAGGSRSMLVRDADQHYLVTFRDDCGSLAMTSSVRIVSEGSEGRLCPTGSVVKTKRDNCVVRGVETIDAEQFTNRKRRTR